jgi:hypothetical protein
LGKIPSSHLPLAMYKPNPPIAFHVSVGIRTRIKHAPLRLRIRRRSHKVPLPLRAPPMALRPGPRPIAPRKCHCAIDDNGSRPCGASGARVVLDCHHAVLRNWSLASKPGPSSTARGLAAGSSEGTGDAIQANPFSPAPAPFENLVRRCCVRVPMVSTTVARYRWLVPPPHGASDAKALF